MRVVEECYRCLEGLIRKTAELATADPDLMRKAAAAGMAVLDREFPRRPIPVRVAAAAQRAVREISGNADPFAAVKRREMAMAAGLVNEVTPLCGGGLAGLITLSALGNAVDFFRDLAAVRHDIKGGLRFARDERDLLARRLERSRVVLFLADNAAEVYFDRPLVDYLSRRAEVVYAVKGGPVQNDLTVADLKAAGIDREMKNIVTTGLDMPGLDLEAAPPEIKDAFAQADLVIAKGMGNYETLSEQAPTDKVFHVLMAKCATVAGSLQVDVGSLVAVFGGRGSCDA
ncbi:MAG: ARMT1-like domain-containing protein [Thermoanaerobacterales bacterium]|nr:ARMT1-like domain-containing protein [Bacillota bacterium]MDI6906830.1 ARMT1-like domain-containing protein [Thermoanaerobacterales bacterium]